MKRKRVNFYFFGDTGSYDDYNPAYVCSKEYAAEIIYMIANSKPFSITKNEVISSLGIDEKNFDEAIESLSRINALEVKEDNYRIKFPIFLEKDVFTMEEYLKNIGQEIGTSIMALEDILIKKISQLTTSSSFSYKRILYHIICDKIFDGLAFDYFEKKDIFCTSKLQPGNRDYIIIAYEESKVVESYSSKLLCSSNNYRACGYTFNSFGDDNGQRKDIFRFFRMTQKSLEAATPFHELSVAYMKLIDNMNKEIAQKCGELILKINKENINYYELSEWDRNIVDFLEEMSYLSFNDKNGSLDVKVPIFYSKDNEIVNELSAIILSNIYPIVEKVFKNLEDEMRELTAIIHGVPIKEIGNEIWHQIFGQTNEYLVRQGFVEPPENIEGEGRYLRSLSTDY
ncbi:hypothetical protein HMPREF1982_02612 [Clostridiales bacterium oral taxon 876 str. F0540]|nr:hypothetical protein HMPREF1982_02612 [Clostridiales bacterium oral taxon 876 str. F0540]